MDTDFNLSVAFAEAHPLDVARILEGLPTAQAVAFLIETPASLAVSLIKLADTAYAISWLEAMPPALAAAVLAATSPDTAAFYCRKIDGDIRDAILALLPEEMARPLSLTLHFPNGSAGSLMDPFYRSIPDDIAVAEALDRIRERAVNVSASVFVVTREDLLAGCVTIRDLLRADPAAPVSQLPRDEVGRMLPATSWQAVLAHHGWKHTSTLPVVDEKGVFLGAIDHQILHRWVEEHAQASRSKPLGAAGSALGELYWIGLSSLASLATEALNPQRR
jgi:magnesium transporter